MMSMKTITTLLLAAGLAACGGKGAAPADPTPPPDTTPAPDEHAMHDEHAHHHAADPGPTEPAGPTPEELKANLRLAEDAAFAAAKPVFETFCASCHQQGQKGATQKKLDHFDMTRYPFEGEHAGEMAATIRTVLGIDGGKATMPKGKPGTVKGDDLALIAAWADAFQASHEGGAHEGLPGHEGHHGH